MSHALDDLAGRVMALTNLAYTPGAPWQLRAEALPLALDLLQALRAATALPMPDDRPELDRYAETEADAEREARLDALSAPERPDDGRD